MNGGRGAGGGRRISKWRDGVVAEVAGGGGGGGI